MWVLSVPLLTCIGFECLCRDIHMLDLSGTISALLAVAIYLPLCAWISMLLGLRIRSQLKAMLFATGGITAWIMLPLLLPPTLVLSLVFLLLSGLTLLILRTVLFPGSVISLSRIMKAGRITLLATVLIYALIAWASGTPFWFYRLLFFIPGISVLGNLTVLLSPALILKYQSQTTLVPVAAIAINYVWYTGLAFLVRELCLRSADTELGRISPPVTVHRQCLER